MVDNQNYEYNFFNKNKYIKINPSKTLNENFSNFYSFNGKTSELIRDDKDAGALKASKEYLENNYHKYSKLLIENEYLNFIEKKLRIKLYPYKLMHVLSDDQTGHLIWHRDVYMHNGKNIGPKWPLYKLAIYLQKTDKSNGITGFIPGRLNISFNNRYIDTFYAYLLSAFAFHASVNTGGSILFSGEVMHNRPKSKTKNFRQAIIFSLTTAKDVFNTYVKNKNSLPYHLRKMQNFNL